MKSGHFKMKDTLNGKNETLYDIHFMKQKIWQFGRVLRSDLG